MDGAKNGTETAQLMAQNKLTKFSRNDIRFWEARVYQPAFSVADGDDKKVGFYHVKIQAHGERRRVSLKETQNRKAAKAAMELDSLVQALGWEQGLAKFRGDTPTPRNNLTLGDYLLEVAVTGEITPRTLRTYTTKVRRIAADIGEIRLRGKLNKYDYVNGGTKAWQDLVDAVPLRALSPAAVRTWLTAYLLPSQGNPAKRESAIKSANSCIRAGKAIFAAKILERLTHLVLPDPIPFSGMRTRREEITRYRSEIADPKQLLVAGMKELAHATMDSQNQALWELGGCEGPAPEPAPGERIRAGQAAFRMREAFKVLILSLSAGLRRGEIDRLQWNQVDFDRKHISVKTTDAHKIKANSIGDIPVDTEIIALLKILKSSSTSRFVVNGVEPNMLTDKTHYRAELAHVELIHWLKTKGIKARNPVHSMRKEYGSIVCAKAGIYVASRLLRHASIQMTASIYADDRASVTSGLGDALAE